MPIFLIANFTMTTPKDFENTLTQTSDAYRTLIASTGENLDREGLLDTPERAAKAFGFLTQGYHQDLVEITNDAIFPTDNNELILVKNIEFYSMCEHHMLPFYGVAHVAYLPNDKVIGLSKMARIVDMYARRLQIQENLTRQVAQAVMDIEDEVLAEAADPQRPGGRAPGRVEVPAFDVLERGHKKIVGRYEKGKGFGFVIPDNDRICKDIFIPERRDHDARTEPLVVLHDGLRHPLEVRVVRQRPRMVVLRQHRLAQVHPAPRLAEPPPVHPALEQHRGFLALKDRHHHKLPEALEP